MSGSLPTQDLATQIREAAVASLTSYGVTVNSTVVPVESERVDPVETGATPRIIVYADDSGTSKSRGGSAPAFDVTAQIVVQGLVQRAARADAVADLDAMVAQIKDCLFGDPAWVMLSQNISTVRVARAWKPQGEQIFGDARVLIECTWVEIYPPRVTQPLATVTLTTNPPAGTQAIAAGVILPTS